MLLACKKQFCLIGYTANVSLSRKHRSLDEAGDNINLTSKTVRSQRNHLQSFLVDDISFGKNFIQLVKQSFDVANKTANDFLAVNHEVCSSYPCRAFPLRILLSLAWTHGWNERDSMTSFGIHFYETLRKSWWRNLQSWHIGKYCYLGYYQC